MACIVQRDAGEGPDKELAPRGPRCSLAQIEPLVGAKEPPNSSRNCWDWGERRPRVLCEKGLVAIAQFNARGRTNLESVIKPAELVVAPQLASQLGKRAQQAAAPILLL